MSLQSTILCCIAIFLLAFVKTSVNDDEIPQLASVSMLADKVCRGNSHLPLKLTEYTLQNGMRISLQECDKEKDEFHFLLFAPGGYTSLPPEERVLGWACSKVAYDSGVNGLTADEFSYDLVSHNLEMRIRTHLFERSIEASGPVAELAHCLEITKLFLSAPQFTDEGFKSASKRSFGKLDKRATKGNIHGLRDIFLQTNMQNWDIIKPFNFDDLKALDLTKVEPIYRKLYSNPAEFNFVLAGDINSKLVQKQIEQTLGSLPKTSQFLNPPPPAPPFPEGIRKEFSGFSRYKQSLTRITFVIPRENADLNTLDLLSAHLNRKVKSLITNADSLKREMTINYEFPLFPCLDVLWLQVQFSSPKSQIEPYCRMILKSLERAKQDLDEDEIAYSMMALHQRRSIAFDHTGELLLLSNYCRSGRNKDNLYITEYDEKTMLKKVKECYPDVSKYSIITLHP